MLTREWARQKRWAEGKEARDAARALRQRTEELQVRRREAAREAVRETMRD
jgi:hypothetical protein